MRKIISKVGDLTIGRKVYLGRVDGKEFGTLYHVNLRGTITIKRRDGESGCGAAIPEAPYNGESGWAIFYENEGDSRIVLNMTLWIDTDEVLSKDLDVQTKIEGLKGDKLSRLKLGW